MLAPADLSRIVIIGNSGSGKSWLAERLANQLRTPTIDLDEIHWLPGGYQARRDPAEARAAVQTHAARDRWIMEGVYGWLVAEALPKATALLLLDMPDEVCVANVQARGLRRGGDEASHMELIAWICEYRARQNSISWIGHAGLFDSFAGPKLRLRSRAELAALINVTLDRGIR